MQSVHRYRDSRHLKRATDTGLIDAELVEFALGTQEQREALLRQERRIDAVGPEVFAIRCSSYAA